MHKNTNLSSDKYLKIGEIAKLAGILPSKIRYYTNIGLLKVSGYTQGKYRLYDKEKTLSYIKKIEELIEKRYYLNEIKAILNKTKKEPDFFRNV